MKILFPFLAFASGFSLSQAAALQSRSPTYIFNNGNAYWIDKLNHITPPNRIIAKRAYGTAPEHCVLTAKDNSFCAPYNIEVFDIYYADCHAPWVVCRCTDVPSDYNIDVIADNIGKIPVRARSWVRHYSFYPSNLKYAAYSTLNDINVFGSWAVSTVLFHETGHNLDKWVANSDPNSPAYSGTTAWTNQINQDSCWPTQYASTNSAEDFAEVSVQATYEENFGGIPIDTTCFTHTETTSRNLLRSAIKMVPGDLCLDRITPSTSVCLGPTARAQGYCNNVLDATAGTGGSSKMVKKAQSAAEGTLPVHILMEDVQRAFDANVSSAKPRTS
ncbi:hypothetical protein BKA65DRAFT_596779 [Rhexocercosporidium sp. MPI-PUGE-AT-0058]|nr:hypothetical protein BKA65DRAFT_596779 [Rhexocercosporidium sp. MPI-PUGE-AT-0058]